MFVKEFSGRVASIASEVGCDGGQNIASHAIGSSVTVTVEGDESKYEIVDIEPSMMFGCGCWDGIALTIKRERL